MRKQMFFVVSSMVLSMNIIGMHQESSLMLMPHEMIYHITHHCSLESIGRFKQTCKKYSNDDIDSDYYTGRLIFGLNKESSMAAFGLVRELGEEREENNQNNRVQKQHLRFLQYFAKKEDQEMFDFFYSIPTIYFSYQLNYYDLLIYAFRVDDGDLANFLINHKKVDFNMAKDSTLWLACWRNNNKSAKILIEMGANVDYAPDSNSIAPLWFACARGNNELAKMLIEMGANINYASEHCLGTSLHRACDNGNVELAKYLIENGADVNIVDVKGNSSLDIMKTKPEFKELVDSLPFLEKNFRVIRNATVPLVVLVGGIGCFLYAKFSQ